jgi:hypothetical protein
VNDFPHVYIATGCSQNSLSEVPVLGFLLGVPDDRLCSQTLTFNQAPTTEQLQRTCVPSLVEDCHYSVDTIVILGPPKPQGIIDSELQRITDTLYKSGAKLGNGGTADAFRLEGSHEQAAWDRAGWLERWFQENPGAAPNDMYIANLEQQDLLSALSGEDFFLKPEPGE